jgi:heat shock protein HslJ
VDFSRAWQFMSTLAAALCLLAPAQAAPGGLTGTVWQLIQFQGSNGQTLKPPEDEAAYTVEFKTDNTIVVRLDCNRGRGTWLSRAPSQLELGPLGLTRANCPQSLSDQISKQWPLVHSYVVRDGHLFLALTANGGTYEFEPANSQAATASPAPAAAAASSLTQVPAQPAAQPQAAESRTQPTGQPSTRSWLDDSKPLSWNAPGAVLPSAPKFDAPADPRCQGEARPPDLEADKRLKDLGWDLIGPYQGGWGILIIQGTAGYDGMCRPRAYQFFVFYHGVFAGTLSPRAMDSRSDGALMRVSLHDGRRLVAEYMRYTPADPLCCASRTTSVVFEVVSDQALVRPVSASTSSNR